MEPNKAACFLVYLDESTFEDADVIGSRAARLHAEVKQALENAADGGSKIVLMHDKRLLDQPTASLSRIMDMTPRDLFTNSGEGGLFDTMVIDRNGTPGSQLEQVSMRLLLAELAAPSRSSQLEQERPRLLDCLLACRTGLVFGRRRCQPTAILPLEQNIELSDPKVEIKKVESN